MEDNIKYIFRELSKYEQLALERAEDIGVYEYIVKGCRMIYYSFFGSEGFVKVVHNLRTGKEDRKSLRYKKVPKFLKTEDGATKYNYFCG